MAVEIISEIKNTEQLAREIIINANKEAKEIISKATLDAEQTRKSILDNAKSEGQEIIDAAVTSANIEAEKLFEKGEKDCKSITSLEQEKIDQAVKLVIERIVNIHGNS
ncbi:MAG: ATPase [Sarcina sp.]